MCCYRGLRGDCLLLLHASCGSEREHEDGDGKKEESHIVVKAVEGSQCFFFSIPDGDTGEKKGDEIGFQGLGMPKSIKES